MTTTPALSRCTVETNNNSQPNKTMIFTQSQYKNRLATLEAQIISLGARATPDTRDAKLEIFGMAESKVMEIASRTPKGKLLETLAKEHLREEKQRESKATASAPVRPASAAPAAAPVRTSTIDAKSLACAILDEQEARAAAAKIKTREQFTAMSPKDQSLFCRSGGRIV
jgi:hypothetical protein